MIYIGKTKLTSKKGVSLQFITLRARKITSCFKRENRAEQDASQSAIIVQLCPHVYGQLLVRNSPDKAEEENIKDGCFTLLLCPHT